MYIPISLSKSITSVPFCPRISDFSHFFPGVFGDNFPFLPFRPPGIKGFPFPGEERIKFQFFSALSRELHFEYSVAPSLLVEDNAINSEILAELLPEA